VICRFHMSLQNICPTGSSMSLAIKFSMARGKGGEGLRIRTDDIGTEIQRGTRYLARLYQPRMLRGISVESSGLNSRRWAAFQTRKYSVSVPRRDMYYSLWIIRTICCAVQPSKSFLNEKSLMDWGQLEILRRWQRFS
jgi:hypothetical protein